MKKYIDLTFPLHANTPRWNSEQNFTLQTTLDYQDCTSTTKFKVQSFAAPCGIGTHIDAPAHCIPGGTTIDQLAIESLIRPYIKIDVAAQADENYQINMQDIIKFEKQHGKIEKNCFVVLHTGWVQKHGHNHNAYRNAYQFPTLSIDAAHYLVEKNVVGIGIDTLSPDLPTDNFAVHEILLKNNIYIVENLYNTHLLAATGTQIIIAPLNIEGGTEAPVRVLAKI